jgi:hypothetical protein
LAFVDPDSAEHDELLTKLLELRDSLTAAEKATIQEAYDRLAMDSGSTPRELAVEFSSLRSGP